MTTDADRLRRLAAAARETPLEQLADQLADQVDAALVRRSQSQRSLSAANRKALQRCAAGDSLTLKVLVRLAAACGCSIRISLVDAEPLRDEFVPPVGSHGKIKS